MAMPELTKEQKAALVVSRMARTVAHHEAARRYAVNGKEKLDDAEWEDVAENNRFFKVTVEMP